MKQNKGQDQNLPDEPSPIPSLKSYPSRLDR